MVKPFDRHDPLRAFRDRHTGKADAHKVAAGIAVLEAAHAAARGISERREAKARLARLKRVWAWELKLGKASYDETDQPPTMAHAEVFPRPEDRRD